MTKPGEKTPPTDIEGPDPNEAVVEQDPDQIDEMKQMMSGFDAPKPTPKGGLSDQELEDALSTDEEPATAEEEDEPDEIELPEPETQPEPADEGGDEPVAEEVEEEKPEEEAPVADGEALARLHKIINDQAEQITSLRSGQSQTEQEAPKDEGGEAPEETPVKPVQLKEVATDEEFEEALSDAAKLKEIVQRAVTMSREATLRDVMPIVDQATSRQLSTKEAIKEFREQNPDLEPFTRFVNQLAFEVKSDHPEWSPARVLKETAEKARNQLGIQKQAAVTEKQRREKLESTEENEKPAFAKPPRGGGRRTVKGDGLTEDQKEMKKMLEATTTH